MKAYCINPPAVENVRMVREGRCMQREGAWTAVWTPISMSLCAAVLEKEDIDCRLTDCIVEDVDIKSIQEKVAKFKPDLVVLNSATPSIASDLKVGKYLKEVVPGVRVAAIGIHPTAMPKESFDLAEGLDYIISGEPEYTVRDLAKALRENKPTDAIPGLIQKKEGRLVIGPVRPFIEDLDQLPFPAWHLIDKTKYQMPFLNRPFFLVATGRGCPYQCTFCADDAYYGKKLRLRSPKQIADELEWAWREHGVKDFLFWSESFTINRQFAKDVADEIYRRKLDVHWVCNSRVDNVDQELLDKIKRAGCWMIGYGVESANQKILDSVKKGIKVSQTVEAVMMAKKAGLNVTAHCVLGFPGETKETIRETIDFTKGLPLDFAQYYCAVPFPGSKFYDQALQAGWINSTDWMKFEQNSSVLDMPQLSSIEVMELRNQAYREFYMRPRMVLKTLGRVRNPRDFVKLFGMAKGFASWTKEECK